jgi:hypothetical protein
LSWKLELSEAPKQPIIFSFENAPKKSGNQQVIRENQDFDQ